MFRKMMLSSLASLALMLTAVAHTGIGVRCGFIFYEPDIPKKLKVEL